MIESGFIQAINARIPKEVYRWKTSDKVTRGIPDMYYSSPKGDLWVEYKYCKSKPPKGEPPLTKLQEKWLSDRHKEGRAVAVIVGTPNTNLLYENGNWKQGRDVTRDEIIDWFKEKLC